MSKRELYIIAGFLFIAVSTLKTVCDHSHDSQDPNCVHPVTREELLLYVRQRHDSIKIKSEQLKVNN